MEVEELHIFLALKTCQEFFNGVFVSAFAEIRYRFNDLFHL
jgi:hypothetical protein